MKTDAVSVGMTGFIDILGFGDRILAAKTSDEIDQIRKLVERIQTEFDFDTKNPSTKEVHAIYDKTVLAFSDCVVINIPLQSAATEYEGTFDPIMSELTGFGYAQGTCVLNKLFLRGGFNIGWWYQSGPILISKSMVGAYKTEGRANVPVIALTQELYDFLANHKHRDFYSPDIDPISRTLRKYEADKGGKRTEFWYLDYISICVESLGWQRSESQRAAYRAASPDEKDEIVNQGYRENIDGWLEQHARNIEEAYAGASAEKIRSKYRWLAGYHNEIAVSFTSNTKSLCHLV